MLAPGNLALWDRTTSGLFAHFCRDEGQVSKIGPGEGSSGNYLPITKFVVIFQIERIS
jgi:hypothetical protein